MMAKTAYHDDGPIDRWEDCSIYAPGTVLPSQFFATSSASKSGEGRLCLAVLKLGLADLSGTSSDKSTIAKLQHARDAEFWVRSDDWDWPHSFVNVCETLRLDATAMREWVLADEFKFSLPRGPHVGTGRQITGQRKRRQRKRAAA